jgi:hypothetical protein
VKHAEMESGCGRRVRGVGACKRENSTGRGREAWLPPSLDLWIGGGRGGSRQLGAGNVERRGKQSGMGSRRVLSAQAIFIGTSGTSWSASGGEEAISFHGAEPGVMLPSES